MCETHFQSPLSWLKLSSNVREVIDIFNRLIDDTKVIHVAWMHFISRLVSCQNKRAYINDYLSFASTSL